MARPWQFISTQADGRLDDPKSRKLVRRQAMRDFRRNQRQQMIKEAREKQGHSESSSSVSPLGSPPAHGDTRSVTPEEGGRLLVDYPSLEVGSGLTFDPFSSTHLYSHHDAPPAILAL